MFQVVKASEAKTKLSELLKKVRRGKSFTITVRGEPVADLVPTNSGQQHDIYVAVESMRTFTKVEGVSASDVRDMICEGRRCKGIRL
jgi:prevent-host-death family protein